MASGTIQGKRVASIEGLRAFAILSVVLYHLGVSWFPSGHMGVVMFLALTGYLVTSSVVREFGRTGTVSLPRLWGRRLKRIWPSMAVMVVVVLALCVILNHILLTKMRPDVLPALLFFPNWNYIVRGISYFDQIGGPSPLTHLWYLGIDAQMAVVLPVLLLAGLAATRKVGEDRRRRALVAGLIALSLVSALLMAILYTPDADPSRVYYGTDTRAFSVLLGAAFALVWPLGGKPVVGRDLFVSMVRAGEGYRRADPVVYEARPTRVAQAMGLGGLVALLAIMVFVPAEAAFFYRGGMVLVTLLVLALLASLMTGGTMTDRVFSARPLVWLGGRSYALYLWHYPIIQLMGAGAGAPWWLQVLAVAVSLAAAEASWWLIERPGSLTGFVSRLRAPLDDPRTGLALVGRYAPAGLGAAVLGIALIGSAVVPETTLVPKEAIRSTGVAADKAMDLDQIRASQQANGAASAVADANGSVGQTAVNLLAGYVPQGDITLHAGADELADGLIDPLIIGDSVAGDAADYLSAYAPDGLVDSYVGRTPAQALEVLDQYLAQGVVGKVVVICSFSNNIPTDEELDQMINDCGDRQVYLVNCFIPEVEQDTINYQVAAAVDRHDNAHLIDWNSLAATGVDTWFYDDHTHLRSEWGWVFGQMITNAIAADYIAAGGTIDPDPTDETAAQLAAQQQALDEAAAQAQADALANPGVVYASPDLVAAGGFDPVLIGDSVPGDMDFYSVFPNGLSDSYVGRRPLQALEVYQDYQAQGIVGSVVIFASFSNTTPFSDQLEELVAAVDPSKQVFLVGTVNPEGFQNDANANLVACADAHDNVHYVDWPAVCAGHEDAYLYGDGTHLTPEGAAAYARMLVQAVSSTIVAAGGSVQAAE